MKGLGESLGKPHLPICPSVYLFKGSTRDSLKGGGSRNIKSFDDFPVEERVHIWQKPCVRLGAPFGTCDVCQMGSFGLDRGDKGVRMCQMCILTSTPKPLKILISTMFWTR